jgi:hypothetical protein
LGNRAHGVRSCNNTFLKLGTTVIGPR